MTPEDITGLCERLRMAMCGNAAKADNGLFWLLSDAAFAIEGQSRLLRTVRERCDLADDAPVDAEYLDCCYVARAELRREILAILDGEGA